MLIKIYFQLCSQISEGRAFSFEIITLFSGSKNRLVNKNKKRTGSFE